MNYTSGPNCKKGWKMQLPSELPQETFIYSSYVNKQKKGKETVIGYQKALPHMHEYYSQEIFTKLLQNVVKNGQSLNGEDYNLVLT